MRRMRRRRRRRRRREREKEIYSNENREYDLHSLVQIVEVPRLCEFLQLNYLM